MIYRLENKRINLDRMNPVGNFNNGTLYNVKNYTLKVYDKNIEELPSEKTMRYLSKVKSLQIFMPNRLLYSNDKFCGYTIKNVNKNGRFNKIISTPKDQLLDSIFTLEEEIKFISDKRILLHDLDLEDIHYNGELFIINPDKYLVLNSNSDLIYDTNILELNSLLSRLVSKELNSEKVLKRNIVRFNNLLKDKDIYTSNNDYLDEILSKEENIKCLVKKM
jgi:hypothetical protein